MHDKEHVLAAIRFFNYVDKEDEEELANNILKKIKHFKMHDISVGDKNRFKNYINESDNLIQEGIVGMNYLSDNSFLFNEYYMRTKVDGSDIITFFDEANSAYNPVLRRLLYDERIKNSRELLELYKSIKLKDPKIRKTYIDYKLYKGLNLFVDLSYYNALFLKNNTYKLNRAVDLYFDFIDRLIEDNRLNDNGYSKKTIFIPLFGWNVKSNTDIWDYKENVNPISIIYRILKTNPEKLKNAWGKYTLVFLGEYGYFKLNMSTYDSKDNMKIRNFITKLHANEAVEDSIDEPTAISKDSPKAIVATIVDKIEQSQGITINNLTGKSTISKDELQKKIDNSISSSDAVKTKQIDAKKAELVDRIKAVADTSTDVDDALDNLDNDEYVKNILMDLAAEEDNKVKINAARSSRIAELHDEFLKKEIKNVSIKDMLDPTKNNVVELPSTNIGKHIDTINDEWKDMKFVNFEKVYDLDRDIIKILNSFSSKTYPIAIRNVEVEDTSTSEDSVETYTVQCEDSNGQRFTLKFDIPKFKSNRFMKLRGNEKVLSGQLLLLPVIKTDMDTVQVVSNYNKIFIRRFGSTTGKSFVVADRIIKTLDKFKINGIKIVNGDNSKICAKFELPVDYIDLATEYTRIETKDFVVYFNQEEIRSLYKIDETKGIPFAYDKNSNTVIYYNDTNVFSVKLLEMLKAVPGFSDNYDKTSVSTKYTYSKASILNAKLPLIVVLGYNIGLLEVLKKANIKYEIGEKRPSIDKNKEDVIKFSDGYLSYELNYASSMLLNGLKECDTADYSISEINSKPMWLDFLDSLASRIVSDGLDSFYDLMIDPITAEVCRRYKLPDNYVDILLYANNLLADNKYNRHTDLTGNRYRTNEIVAGYVYKALCNSYQDYTMQLKRGRKDVAMTMKRSSVIDNVLLDPTMSDLSILNPLLEVEAANTVSFKGLSGMNTDRAYGLDKRTYDDTMVNLLALSTGFTANAGISRQTTMDMNIEGERGYLKTTDNPDNMNITKTFSITEALTPFGTTHDDPFRSAMTFIQTSKHGMRVKTSMPSLITNGADEALPYISSDTFAFKAKQNGVIKEKTDDYLVIEYKDGTNDFVDLRELVKKNSDGGFYITIKLDSALKVGDRVEAGEIVAYDKLSYSDRVSPNNNAAYNVGTLAKMAILNTDEGFEDSGIIDNWLSEAMASEIVVKKEVVLPKSTNIYNMVKKGQSIQEGDPLLIIQNAFDDNDMNILLKNLAGDEEEITDLARIPIKSKVTGIVQDIQIYRTVDKSELSDSLLKAVNNYEKEVKATKKVMDKYNIDGSNEFTADYKLEPIGKLKNARDSVMIEFYLKYFDKMSVGDKIVVYSANKAVIKDIFPDGMEPYSEFRKDEKINSLTAIGSINARMVTSIKTVAGINKVLVELDRSVKDILGIPYKYLTEME